MAVEARTTLDAQKLRADFPILQQEINGKPLAYLDSAVTAQKPRQMLEAMTFYKTSYGNVHRGVYALASGRRRRSRRARPDREVRQRAFLARADLHPERDGGPQPRRLRLRARAARAGDVVVVTELELTSSSLAVRRQANGRVVPDGAPDRQRRGSTC